MAQIGSMNITGQSERKYNFGFYPMGEAFKAIGAVYVITKRVEKSDGSRTHTFIYVGETGDLSTRFDDHHKQDCFDEHNANCIGVHIDGAKQSRLDKEQDLLAARNWPCND